MLIVINLGLLGYQHYYPSFIVEGDSMMPTLHEEDLVRIVSHREPKRFDVVVLHPPSNEDETYIKRIIGLPGENLSYRNGQLYVNGKAVGDEFGSLTMDFSLDQLLKIKQIPDDYYFVLGDNREVSQDSRSFGLVNRSDILGTIERRQ